MLNRAQGKKIRDRMISTSFDATRCTFHPVFRVVRQLFFDIWFADNYL
jgi:hypothetical protein